MPSSLDELRKILVELWCIVSPDHWEKLVGQFSDPAAIVASLVSETRFRISHRTIRFITPAMQQALQVDQPASMVIGLDRGNWLKLESIGSGGQGEVWLACPCNAAADNNQLVALKSPKAPARSNETVVPGSLRQEIEILRQITCDHVAALVDEDWPSGMLATRFVDGECLEQKVNAARRLSVVQAIQIGIDICHALEALHAINWIHKDVKPDNIMLDKSQRAVLVDFGLAELSTARSTVGGTPYYIAPEVLFSDTAPDSRADVFSLAATLYRLLSGYPPYFQHCLHPSRLTSSRAVLDALYFRLADSAIECDLETLRREVPRQLCQLIIQGLSSNRDKRPSSVQEFRAKLDSLNVKLSEAVVIERELWGLSDVLLEMVRNVSYDPNYSGRELNNAKAIRDDLQRNVPQFSQLRRLQSMSDSWIGVVVDHSIVLRTMKIAAKIDATCSQIDAFLTSPAVRDPGRNELLKNLVARTLESLRSISIDTVAAAHEWQAVLLQLGLIDLRKPPVTSVAT
jgi:serine/threonine protein kinase